MTVRLAREARECAEIFSAEAKRAGATSMWSDAAGDVAQEICRRARYTDLVVVGQYERQEPVERHPLPSHAVVLDVGRPVLVRARRRLVDQSRKSCHRLGRQPRGRQIGERCAAAARAFAFGPILKIVPPSGPAEPANFDDLAAHLVRHGVRVEPDSLGMKTAAEHAHLRDQIGQGGYDLAVMGAYSHPPWFEFVFGGATQSILSSSVIPVLVSH